MHYLICLQLAAVEVTESTYLRFSTINCLTKIKAMHYLICLKLAAVADNVIESLMARMNW